jgi:hypothetical protein
MDSSMSSDECLDSLGLFALYLSSVCVFDILRNNLEDAFVVLKDQNVVIKEERAKRDTGLIAVDSLFYFFSRMVTTRLMHAIYQ